MNAKDKASDLVCNFYQIQSNEYDYGINWEMAKQCALIAVTEMLNSMSIQSTDECQYWEQVKSEIIQL
jgi:molybdate-binding protein